MDDTAGHESESQVAEPVCSQWQRLIEGAIGVFVLGVAALSLHYYWPPSRGDVRAEVQQLKNEVADLRQEQAMPAMVLNRYRNSICYIYGVYNVGFPGRKPSLRARVSGTGFVVAQGLLATNRHVAQPWVGDPDAATLIEQGAQPKLEKLVAFFPGLPNPLNITPSAWSDQGDLAVVKIEDGQAAATLRSVPLSDIQPAPGELVTVVGYPMGVLGMIAKSPQAIYERLAFRHDDIGVANELSALSLIRPSATCGHLGDVVGDKLIYDAPTAHGGSGGPVFNARGEAIGINSAFMDGFSGGTLGISVQALKPLVQAAQARDASH